MARSKKEVSIQNVGRASVSTGNAMIEPQGIKTVSGDIAKMLIDAGLCVEVKEPESKPEPESKSEVETGIDDV